MIIDNATLLRIDTPGPSNGAGDSSLVAGPAMICRCLVSDPTYAEVVKGWGKLKTGNQIFRCKVAPFQAALGAVGMTVTDDLITLGQVMTIKPDRGPTTARRIVKATVMPHKSMSMVIAELESD